MQPVTYTALPTRSQQSWRRRRRLPKGAGGAQPAAQVRRRPPQRRQSGPGQEEGRPAARNKGGRGGDGAGGGRDGGAAAQEAREGEGQGGQQQGGRYGAQACFRLPPLSGAQLFFFIICFMSISSWGLPGFCHFYCYFVCQQLQKVSCGYIFLEFVCSKRHAVYLELFKRSRAFTTRAFKSYTWSVGLAKHVLLTMTKTLHSSVIVYLSSCSNLMTYNCCNCNFTQVLNLVSVSVVLLFLFFGLILLKCQKK